MDNKCNFIHYGSDEGLHRHLSAWTTLYENMAKAYMQLASTMREECIKLDKSCTLDEGDNINRALGDISRLLITNIKRNAEHLDNQWRGFDNPRSYWDLLNKLDNKFEVGLELQFNSLLSTRDKQEDIIIKAHKRYMKNYDQWSKLDENRNRFWPKSRLSSRLTCLKKKMEKSFITYRKAYEKDEIDREIFRESLGYLEEDWITRENEIIGKWRSATQSLIFKLENSSPLATRRFFENLIHGVIQFDVPRLVNFSLIERRSDAYYFLSFHEHFESLESDKKNRKFKLTSDSGNESQEDSLYMHRKESPVKRKTKNESHQKYVLAEDIDKSKSHFSPRLSRRDIHKPGGSRRAASPSSRPLGRCKATQLNSTKETSRNSLESSTKEKNIADNTEFLVPNTNEPLNEYSDQCVALSIQTNKIVEKIKKTNSEQAMETGERNTNLLVPKAETDMDLREAVAFEGLPQVIPPPVATQPTIICSRGSEKVKAHKGICSQNPEWEEFPTDDSRLCNGQVEQKTQDFQEQPQHEVNDIGTEVAKVKNLNTEHNMELSARIKSLRKRVTTKIKKGNFTDGSSDENDVLPLKLKKKKLKKKKKMPCESNDNLPNPTYEVVSFPENKDIIGSSDTTSTSDDEAIDSWSSSTSSDADKFPDNTVQNKGHVVLENTLDVSDTEHELSTKTSGKIIGIHPIAVKLHVPNDKIPLGKDQGLSDTLPTSTNIDEGKLELESKTPLQDWESDSSLNSLPKYSEKGSSETSLLETRKAVGKINLVELAKTFKEKKRKEEEKLRDENEKSRKALVTDWGSDTDISYEKEMGTKLLDTLKPDNIENNTKINLIEFAKKFDERRKEKEEKLKDEKEELRKAVVADWNSDNDSPISSGEKVEIRSQGPLKPDTKINLVKFAKTFEERKKEKEEQLNAEKEELRKAAVADWNSDDDSSINTEEKAEKGAQGPLTHKKIEINSKINLVELAKEFEERKQEKEEKMKAEKEELRKSIVADWNSDDDSSINTEERAGKGPLTHKKIENNSKINLVELAKEFEERKQEKEEKLKAEKEELRKAVVADWNSDDDSPISTDEKVEKQSQDPLKPDTGKNNTKINLVEFAKKFEERKKEKEEKMKAEKEEIRISVVADWNSDDDSPISTDEKVEKQSQDPLKTDTGKNNTKINLVEFAKKFEERKKEKEEKMKAEKEELRKSVVADWNSDDDSPISTDEKVEKQSQDPLKTNTGKNNTKFNLVEFAKKFEERKKEKEEKMKAEKEELRKSVVADWNSDDDSPISTDEKVEKQSQDPLKTDTGKNNTKINLVEFAKKFEERKKEKENKLKAEKEELRKAVVADWNSDDDSPISFEEKSGKRAEDLLTHGKIANNSKMNLVELAKKFEERKREKEERLSAEKEELRKAVVADWDSDNDSPISMEEKPGKRAEDPLTHGKIANNSKINLVELAKKFEERKREKEERLCAEKEELRKAVVADWDSDDDTELSLEKETGNTFFESSNSGTGQNNYKVNLVELAKQFEEKKKEKEDKLKEGKEELNKAAVANWDSDDNSEASQEKETGLKLLASLKADKTDKNKESNLVELAKQFEEKKKEEKLKDKSYLEVVSSWDSGSEIHETNSYLEVVSSWDTESEINDAKSDLEVVSSWDSDCEDESRLTEDKKTKTVEQSGTSKGKDLDIVFGEGFEKNSWDSDTENSSRAEKEQARLSESKETNIVCGVGPEKNSWDSDTENSCQADEVHAQSSKGKNLDIDYGEGLEKNSWDSDTENSCQADEVHAQSSKGKDLDIDDGEGLEKNSWDSDTENSCQTDEVHAQSSKGKDLDIDDGEELEKNSWDSDTENICQAKEEQAQASKSKETDIVYGEGLGKDSWDTDSEINCQLGKEQAQSSKAKVNDIVYDIVIELEKNSWDSNTEDSFQTGKKPAQPFNEKVIDVVYREGLEKNSFDTNNAKSGQTGEELAQPSKVKETNFVYSEILEKNSWDSDTENSCQAGEEPAQSTKEKVLDVVHGEGQEKNNWDSDTEKSCQAEEELSQSSKAEDINIVYGEGLEKNSWDSDTEKSRQAEDELSAAVISPNQNVNEVQIKRTMVDNNAGFTPTKSVIDDESSGKASGAREFRNVSFSSEVKINEIENRMDVNAILDETDSEYESNTDAIIISTESESCSRDQHNKKVPEPTEKIVNTLFGCDSGNDRASVVGTKTQYPTEEECKQEERDLVEKIAARNKILDGLLASAALLNVDSNGYEVPSSFSEYPAKSNTGLQFDNTEPSVHVTNVGACENQPTEVESKLDKDKGSISFESTEDRSENGKPFIFCKQEFETAHRKDFNSHDDFQQHSYPTDIDESVECEENKDGHVEMKENEDMVFRSTHSSVIAEEEEIIDINPHDVRGSWRKILDVQKKDVFYPELKKESKISLDVMNPVTALKSKSDKSPDLGEGKSEETKNVASQWEELLKQQKYDQVDKVLSTSKSVAKVKSGEPLASCSNVSRGRISNTESQVLGAVSLLSKGGFTGLSINKKATALAPLKDENSQRVKKKKNPKKGDTSCDIQKKRESPLYDRHPYKNFGAPGRPLSVHEEQEVYQHQLAEETTSQMPQSRPCNHFDEYGRPLTVEEAAMMEEEMASLQERQLSRRKELQVEKSTMEKIRDMPRPTRQLPLRQKTKQGLHEMKVKQEPIIKNKILFRTEELQPVQMTAQVMSEMSVDNSMVSSIGNSIHDLGQGGASKSVYPGQFPPGPSQFPPGSHPRNLQPPKAAKGVQQRDNGSTLDENFTHLMTKRTDPDLKSSKDKFSALVASKTKNEKPKKLELQLCSSLSLDLTEDRNKDIISPEIWPLWNTTNKSLDETFGPLSPPSSGRAPLKANWEPPASSKKKVKQSTLDKTYSPLSPSSFGRASLKANWEQPTASQISVKPLTLDETFGPLSPPSSGRAPLKANWEPPTTTENATKQEKLQTSKYLKSRKATDDLQGPSNSKQFAEPASISQQALTDKQESPLKSNRLQLEPLSPSRPKESQLKSRSSTAKSPDTKQNEAGILEENVQKKSKRCKESRKQKKKLATKKKVDEEAGNTSDDSYPSLNDPCYDI